MRFFDELITLPARDGGAATPVVATDETPRGTDTSRPPGLTARHVSGRRAEMAPAAFCKLVAIWLGAVGIALVAVLTIRWFG